MHQRIVPSTLLAPATNIRTYKATRAQIYICSNHWHMSYFFKIAQKAYEAKQQFCTSIMLFCTFLCHHCMTVTWKYLVSCFMEDNKLATTNFSFSFLTWVWSPRNQLQGISPTCDIFTKLEWTWCSLKKREFILKVMFSSLVLIKKFNNFRGKCEFVLVVVFFYISSLWSFFSGWYDRNWQLEI